MGRTNREPIRNLNDPIGCTETMRDSIPIEVSDYMGVNELDTFNQNPKPASGLDQHTGNQFKSRDGLFSDWVTHTIRYCTANAKPKYDANAL